MTGLESGGDAVSLDRRHLSFAVAAVASLPLLVVVQFAVVAVDLRVALPLAFELVLLAPAAVVGVALGGLARRWYGPRTGAYVGLGVAVAAVPVGFATFTLLVFEGF